MWYSLPSKNSISEWVASSPEDFKVAPKMHKTVTHLARLKPGGYPTLHEMLKLLEPLEAAGKLGPIMVQLPPNLKRNDELLEAFLAEVPHRDSLRWCFDFRNESWHASEVEEILRARNISWVAEDTDEEPAQRRDTADITYVRLRRLAYSDDQLREWTDYFKAKLAEGKDVFVFCRHKDVEAPWKWAEKILEFAG